MKEKLKERIRPITSTRLLSGVTGKECDGRCSI